MALKLMFAVTFMANLASLVTSQSETCYDDKADTTVLDKQFILRDVRTMCRCKVNRGNDRLYCRNLIPNIEAVINATEMVCEDCPIKMDMTEAEKVVQKYIDRLEQIKDGKDMADYKQRIDKKIGRLQGYKEKIEGQIRRTQGYIQYGDMWLRIVTDVQQFFPAKTDCEKDGGHLVYIKDDSELNFIANILKGYTSEHIPSSSVWVGAEDLTTEGSFQWLDGSPVETSLFASGEPNDSSACSAYHENLSVNYKNHTNVQLADGQDCLVLSYHSGGLDDNIIVVPVPDLTYANAMTNACSQT